MNPSDSAGRMPTAIEWLRWACVAPAAVAGEVVVGLLAGMLVPLAAAPWESRDASPIVPILGWLLRLSAPLAFVVLGAKTAPRGRTPTATVLALARAVVSLVVHILGQAHLGPVNVAHFAAECAGVALGLAWVVARQRRHPG